eukprot:CAMPEP_0194037266 /NCGR_PEP_ID=MMETSP0009_2-20130614/9601_1 /TAXON_ID=210454 /ORGANISM="Grammatophora oceanica, Strain CCMP 410" /LENGTH=363 /DNA_ID=CAMNT_0038679355 /DNA_START=122 /DNA_END=1213 /DNA_ORIENTATION=+
MVGKSKRRVPARMDVTATTLVVVCFAFAHLADATATEALRDSYDDRRLAAQAKIVNGAPAAPGSYPFFVTLYATDDPPSGGPACGGSLVAPSVILTAAHCVESIQSAEYGRYDLNINDGVQARTNITSVSHPDYNPDNFDYDYALIGLDTPFDDPFLVSLRRTPEIPPDLSIMGFGAIRFLSPSIPDDQIFNFLTDELLEANVTRFPTDECRANYDPDPITERMFCANDIPNGRDSCQGDSGGPIVVQGQNVQVGLVSFGDGCGQPEFPGVYSRIDTGFEWIQETVCKDLSPDYCVNGVLPAVDGDGQAVDLDCEDKDSFLGLGKKLQLRNCTWVGEFVERRCPWYGELYCPQTCDVDACRIR